jgi:hypothetical protein
MPLAPDRSALLCYNTVERMLKGDFFHTVTWEDVAADIAPLPGDSPLIGIGTTNWFRRNGETMIVGTVGQPRCLWADPEGEHPLGVIDLLHQRPEPEGQPWITPSLQDGDSPPLPFLALGLCRPRPEFIWELERVEAFHPWLHEKLSQENVGLAAVEIQGIMRTVTVSAAFYLPLEGLDLSHGYDARDNLKIAEFADGLWTAGGIYAANPTVQRMISVEGLPLHLHGTNDLTGQGGHLVRLSVEKATVRVWTLQDLVLQIRNLDQAWLPIRNLARGTV